MLVCEARLIELLARHPSTLHRLGLCQVGLWEGSLRTRLVAVAEVEMITEYYKAVELSRSVDYDRYIS